MFSSKNLTTISEDNCRAIQYEKFFVKITSVETNPRYLA